MFASERFDDCFNTTNSQMTTTTTNLLFWKLVVLITRCIRRGVWLFCLALTQKSIRIGFDGSTTILDFYWFLLNFIGPIWICVFYIFCVIRLDPSSHFIGLSEIVIAMRLILQPPGSLVYEDNSAEKLAYEGKPDFCMRLNNAKYIKVYKRHK